ncbi:MAG: hypothetical protein IT560_11800 [Alphaproteobacteria bacterium]|nr:hypothetical protein [Alphaproteobacteria bacterium]
MNRFAAPENRRRGIWAAFILVISIPLVMRLLDLAGWPALSAPLRPYNPDVWLRLSLVRDWLAGNDFFGHAVPQTNAPAGGIQSHWTRPLDFILAGLYSLMPQKSAPELRLMMAAAWYPFALSVVAAGLMAKAARKIFNHTHVVACTILLFLCSPFMADYFRPGDADHHGLMSVLWCGVLALLVQNATRPLQAGITGMLLGLIIWISPEGLIIYAAALGVMGIGALRAAPQDSQRFVAPAIAAAVTAVTVTIGLLVEVPVKNILVHAQYDSLSIVQVSVLWVAAAAACVTMQLWRQFDTVKLRFVIATAAGLCGAALIYALYPKFFMGPMADADPYVFTDFLPVVSEAKPLFAGAFSNYAPILLQPILAVILLAAVLLRRRTARRSRPLVILAGLLAVMLLLTMVQARWAYYLAPVSTIICAGLLPTVSIAARRFPFAPRRFQPYLWIAVLAAYMGGSVAASVKSQAAGNAPGTGCMSEIRYVIQTQQLQKILGTTSDIFYTYEDVGTEMIFFTPYRIIASNYHREAGGLRDLKNLRAAADIDSFHALLKKRKVDTLLVCPVYHPRFFKQGAELPAWLQPVEGLTFYRNGGNMPLLLRVTP